METSLAAEFDPLRVPPTTSAPFPLPPQADPTPAVAPPQPFPPFAAAPPQQPPCVPPPPPTHPSLPFTFTPNQRIMVKTTAEATPLFQGLIGKIPIQKYQPNGLLNNQVFHTSGIQIAGEVFVLETSLLAREMGETGWKLISYEGGERRTLGHKRPPKNRELDDFLVDAVVDHFMKDKTYSVEPLIQVFVAQL